jgi:phospholipase C
LLLMFDENDGFFDHMPPPAPPSKDPRGGWLGGSTADTTGEYHNVDKPVPGGADLPQFRGRPYGLGARVPMIVISPWSRGGWVNSQVFDHTSIIRFLEARFGVMEPNISPWRRAVCGDLTSAFDFAQPNTAPLPGKLPPTTTTAARAATMTKTTKPATPAEPKAPVQAPGVRPSRPLPYRLEAPILVDDKGAHLAFENTGTAGAVFHVYDRLDVVRAPRRYTVAGGERILDAWALQDGQHDLWILGPGGFHRHYKGGVDPDLVVAPAFDPAALLMRLTLRNPTAAPIAVEVAANPYGHKPWAALIPPGASAATMWGLKDSGGWYDLMLTLPAQPGWLRRFAGRLETGRPSISDPAMHGPARMTREV